MFWTNNGQRYQAISAIKTARSYDMTAEGIFLTAEMDICIFIGFGTTGYLSFRKAKVNRKQYYTVSSLLKEKISDVTVIPLLTDGIRMADTSFCIIVSLLILQEITSP